MSNTIKIVCKNYLGNNIQFKEESGRVYLNVVEACLAFNKTLQDLLKTNRLQIELEGIIQFESQICIDKNVDPTEFVQCIEKDKLVWIHYDLFLELSFYLDEEFGIWCENQVGKTRFLQKYIID